MSIKMQSLGVIAGGSAHEGLRVTGGTNATPIVLTINAGHGLKVGDRIRVAGITGLTAANGEWNISAVGAATTITLEGSVGNGTFGGTATCRVLCDKTPFMKGHDASAFVGATDAYDGTVIVEGSDDDTTYATAVKGPALIAAQDNVFVEVSLARYMRFRSSAAGTVGAATCQILA